MVRIKRVYIEHLARGLTHTIYSIIIAINNCNNISSRKDIAA